MLSSDFLSEFLVVEVEFQDLGIDVIQSLEEDVGFLPVEDVPVVCNVVLVLGKIEGLLSTLLASNVTHCLLHPSVL